MASCFLYYGLSIMLHLISSQAFDPEELDATIDIMDVPDNTVKWVEGMGQ